MRKTLLAIAASLSLACITNSSAFASNNQVPPDTKAMHTAIHAIELRWAYIKFKEDGSPHQFADMNALAKRAAQVAAQYPDQVEPVIWEGILASEEAGLASTFHALGYADKARTLLEKAYKENPAAMSAGAPTSLGVLYYRVPGFPFGFGDKQKARALLQQAVSLAPNGMDANYFYADFLVTEHQYAAADKVLKHALSLPVQSQRPLWDKNRRAMIREMLAKVESQQ